MSDLQYYVPTFNRPSIEFQVAYAQLEAAGLAPTLVLSKSDKGNYSAFRHVRAAVDTLPRKRAWIAKAAGKSKFAMLDDDTQLRETKSDGTFKIAGRASLRRMDTYVSRLLEQYPHGAAQRQYMIKPIIVGGGWPFAPNRGRYGQVMFFNPTLWKRIPRFYITEPEETRTLCDMCCQFDLMQQGLPYFRLTRWYAYEVKVPGWRTTGMGQDNRDTMPDEGHHIHTHYDMWKYMNSAGRINMRKACAEMGIPPYLGTKAPTDLPLRYR